MGNQCENHELFERMFQQSLDSLRTTISDGISCLTKQMAEQGKALQKVLENQADRRELCGKQCARLDGIEESDKLQWVAITDLRRLVWMALGGAALAQIIILPVALVIFKSFLG